jgi:hypothetical protein
MIDIEILALDIFDKRRKNIFQTADPEHHMFFKKIFENGNGNTTQMA